ncbi:MAG: sulfatase [Candidatus Poribacteria bacterium]
MLNNRKPNFIVIFCDNMGYGDIGCFGSLKHHTPNVDGMAEQGVRLTSFYVTSGVCTPSRASLMTGCYAQRIDMHVSDTGGCVLRPISAKGLNPSEITIAKLLKEQDYATACIGKWHLGDQPEFLPTRHGFDYYCGIPYSEDMIPARNPKWPPLPLMRNEQVIEAPVDLNSITKRYTQEAINFITENNDKPFFLYLPHATPGSEKIPAVSDEFRGKSVNGRYGDSIEELDWSTGRLLATLKRLGIDNQTVVVFTSDNGAVKGHGGGNAPLAGWGYSTMEGGMRVPCIVRWPGNIPAGKTCDELCTTMDLLPTFARLAGIGPPGDRIIDGKDIWPLLTCQKGAESPYKAFYYYQMEQLQAVRSGKWKLHLPLESKYTYAGRDTGSSPLILCDLNKDFQEDVDVSEKYPEVVKRLLALAEKARDELGDINHKGNHQRPAGFVSNPKPRLLLKNKSKKE